MEFPSSSDENDQQKDRSKKNPNAKRVSEELRIAEGGCDNAGPLSKQPDYEKGRTIEAVKKRPHVKARPFKAASQTVLTGGTKMITSDVKETKVKKIKKRDEAVPVYPDYSGHTITSSLTSLTTGCRFRSLRE